MMFPTTSSIWPHFYLLFAVFTQKHYFVVTCAEVLRNNNLNSDLDLDLGLYAKGFNVWLLSLTRQEAYGSAKKYWERVMRKGRL